MGDLRVVLVPAARWPRWQDNFVARHGATSTRELDGALVGTAADGSQFEARRSLARAWDVTSLGPTGPWGVLLVRKGGFAVARLDGPRVVEHKVGRRHVQGRTKAGGQSQQRFARRRDNQARAAYDAAADHAARVLGPQVRTVVAGGDRDAVDAVLADRRLAHLVVVEPWLPLPDPTRAVLDRAVADASSVRVAVRNR